MHKYIDKQQKVKSIRYSNGVKKIHESEAIYLPKRLYEDDNIFGNIINFISKNKNTISTIASTASLVVDRVGRISNIKIDTIKNIKEFRNIPAITDDAVTKVFNASEVKGSVFCFTFEHNCG